VASDSSPPDSTRAFSFTAEQTAALQQLHEMLRGFGPDAGAALANMAAALMAYDRGISREQHELELESCRRSVAAANAARGSA
jgi:hypothetical protein